MNTLEFSNIFVIESLQTEDELTGRRLFNRAIYPGMAEKKLETNCEYITVASKQDFFDVLSTIKSKVIFNRIYPIIHLEMHGNKTGLQVANLETITWQELQPILIELNVLCKNNLFLTMATCNGGYIYNTVSSNLQSPFWGFVGAFEEVYEDEVLADFTNFYYEFLKSLDLNAAEAALHLQNAPYASKFKFQNTEFAFKKAYKNYEKNHLTPERIEERLSQIENEFRTTMTDENLNMLNLDIKDWSSERIKEFAKNLIVGQNDIIKDRMMTRFFMWDIYPELKN